MIAILKYNAGNVKSVENAIRKLGYEVIVTDDENLLKSADKIIFPGVGEAGSAMRYLKKHKLDELIKSLQQPFLGICLGMQLMCEHSEEGNTAGLGIFQTTVKKFPALELVPQMGWNNFTSLKGELFQNIKLENDCYFVHSFYAEICAETTAVSHYILPFSAGLEKGNFFATQFHPEKSAETGMQILKNFLQL